MTIISQDPATVSSHPRGAHIYNAAAELLRNNPASPDIELSRRQHRQLATERGLRRLLSSLSQEFGSAHVSTLVVSVHAEATLPDGVRYYVRFRRTSP